VVESGADTHDQFVGIFVVQEYGTPIGVEYIARCVDNFGEHRVEIEGRSELSSDLEYLA